MNKIVLAGLLATTLITPITSAMAQDDNRPQRAEKHNDGGQRGDRGRAGGGNGGQQQAPQAQQQQQQQAPRVQGERNDGGRRGGDAQAQGQGQVRAQMQAQQAQAQAQQAQAQQAQAQARLQAQAQQQGQRQFQRGGNDGRFDNGRINRDQTRGPQSVGQTPQAQIRPDGRVQQDWRGQTPNNRRDDNARRGNDGRPNGNQGSQGWNNGGNRNGGARLDDRQRWNGQQRWNNSWRNDRRYDWQNYRNSNRNAFHVQRYNVPYGWSYGYQRFSTGFFLNSLLFGDQYWIDDPYDYRLPPAYGTLRWIRYYDDALLVDIRDGYVVDVIHDFFW